MPIALVVPLVLVLAAAPAPPGPTLAREDTMHTQVPEVLVAAPRVTLDEILDRVARGEARRDSLIDDQAFTATFRLVKNPKRGPGEPIAETVVRVFKKRPDHVRSIVLRQWRKKEKDKDKDNIDITFRSDMGEEVVNFAFRPEARRDFRYHIAGRDIVGNHVIYRLAFEPRSRLDPSIPSGLVWVDTNEFVILRQEVRFERSPVPLFLKDVSRMVIERTNVEGHWVLSRVLLRIETSLPLPQVGRSFDVTLLLNQFAINSGLADSLFATGKKGS